MPDESGNGPKAIVVAVGNCVLPPFLTRLMTPATRSLYAQYLRRNRDTPVECARRIAGLGEFEAGPGPCQVFCQS